MIHKVFLWVYFLLQQILLRQPYSLFKRKKNKNTLTCVALYSVWKTSLQDHTQAFLENTLNSGLNHFTKQFFTSLFSPNFDKLVGNQKCGGKDTEILRSSLIFRALINILSNDKYFNALFNFSHSKETWTQVALQVSFCALIVVKLSFRVIMQKWCGAFFTNNAAVSR